MSSGKPKGKRRGRPPKVVRDPASEIPGMFVLPPNILEKLGIKLNMGNCQNAPTSSAMPLNQESLPGTQVDSNAKSVRSHEGVVVDKKVEESSILETANLMKSSVFLSPTFNHPVTNTNIENAELEFLSPNQEINATMIIEKPVSDEHHTIPTAKKNHRNHATKDIPDTVETKTIRKKKNPKKGKVITVDSECNKTGLDIHAEILKNLRKKIQITNENVLSNSEKVHVDSESQEIVASTSTLAPKPPATDYIVSKKDFNFDLGKVHADLSSKKAVTLEPKRAVAGVYDIPENSSRDLNDTSELVKAPEINESNPTQARLDTSKKTYFDDIESETYAKGSSPDSKTTDKRSEIIEPLIEVRKVEDLVAEEMELEHYETSKHLKDIQLSIQQNSEIEKTIDASGCDGQDMPSNENIGKEVIENLRKAITSDIIVLADENKDYSVAEIPNEITPQKKSSGGLQKNIDIIECDRPIFVIADKANKLLDDHLDEAYLSDCSNSNMGPSGSIGSEQEMFEPLPTQTPCTDVKYSKISILSQEIIEPSTFNLILKKSKKRHQKEKLIPVSINTVVSLSHKKSNDTKIDFKIEPKSETIITSVERNLIDDKGILIEFIDEYENKTPENTLQNQLTSSADTVSEPNVHSLTSPITTKEPKEEASLSLALQSSSDVTNPSSIDAESNKERNDKETKHYDKIEVEESSSCSQSRFDKTPDVTSLSSNDAESNKEHGDKEILATRKSDEKVKEIALYLSKFAHILAHKNAIKKMRNLKRSIATSRFGNKGVDKPGGSDRTSESQEVQCQSHEIWRTYRISQKMPHALYIDWNSHDAKTTATEDQINVQNSTGIVDIEVDFDLSDDFGSMCYHDTTEDLYEHFKSDDAQISLEELFYETDNYNCTIYSDTAENVKFLDVTNEFTKEDTNAHPVQVNLVENLRYQNNEIGSKEKDIFETHGAYYEYPKVDGQLANNCSGIPSAHEYSRDKSQDTNEDNKHIGNNNNVTTTKSKKVKRTELKIFDAMEKDMNDILNNVNIKFLTKEEPLSDDIEDVGGHFDFEVPMCDEGSVEADGRVEAAPSPKKTIKCGVCQKTLSDNEWNDHLSNEHCCIAWKDGEIVDLKSNILLSNLNSRLNKSPLKCTFCTAEFRACKKFLAHVRRCLKTHENRRAADVSSCECGVCHDRVPSEQWSEHIRTRHHYVAWNEGESPIKLKKDVKRQLESVLMLHGCLQCSDCGIACKNADSFLDHINTCERNSSNNRDEIMHGQSSDSESDMKISEVKKCKKTSRTSSTLNANSSLRKTIMAVDSFEEKSEKRKRRKSATNETANRGNRDNSVTAKVLETEPETPKPDKKSEDKPVTSLLFPAQKISKRNTLTDEINSTFISKEVLRNNHITETVTAASEKLAKNSLKSNRTPKFNKEDQLETVGSAQEKNAAEPDESKVTPRNKRKYTQEKRTSPEDNDSDGFLRGRNKSNHDRKNSSRSEQTRRTGDKSTSSEPQKLERNSKVSTRHPRKSTQGKRATSSRNSLNESSGEGQDIRLQSANDKSNDVPQLLMEIKSEQMAPEESSVECAVCQDKVEAQSWMSHCHLNHQYLAWHTGEEALHLDDEYETVEHLKGLVKLLGSIACAKCGLVRKQPRKFLAHIRTCDFSGVEVPILNYSVKPAVKAERYSDDVLTTAETVTCAICHGEFKSDAWEEHAFEIHYNIAWPVGGVPIDLRSTWQIEKILKAYKATVKVLKCNVCGITRASALGFYAHIIVCGKKDEEVEPFKDTCELCNQKYLCIYRQPHYAFHAQQEVSKRRKLEAQELKESLAREKQKIKREDVSGQTPSGKRKAAEKARQFVSENFVDIKAQFRHQCPDCDYGTDSKIKWGAHICGRDSEDGDSFKEEAVSEGEGEGEGEGGEEYEEGEDVVDSNASDDDQPEKRSYKKKKSADSIKPRLMDVPFKVSDIKKYLKYCDRDFCNFHYTSNRLFADWLPANYEMVPDDLTKSYWPPLEESCKVKSADGWTTYKTFEARLDQVPTFFVGGSAKCMSWAPPFFGDDRDKEATGYLAIACHGPRAPRLNFDRTYRHKGLLQIWDFGLFAGTLPYLSLCIAHDYGTVWAMDWCPSGARDSRPGEGGEDGPDGPGGPGGPGGVARLGLLAVACSDGAAYIFSVPYPATLPDRSSMFYKLKPVAELRFDDRKQFQCTTIKWSSQKGHETVAAGYSDGSVAFYSLSAASPLGRAEAGGVRLFYPYSDQRVLSTCISGLDLFASTEPSADTGLACAGSATGLGLWARRGQAVARAQVHAPSCGALFQPHWPSVLSSGEDQLAVTEVEWDGWRGRAGPRVAAASPRSAVVAGYFPPVLRATLGHRLRPEMPRKKVAAIEMKPLSKKRRKERKNTEFEMKVEPLTYDKSIETYGLQLTLLKNDRPAWPNNDECRPERYPLSEVTALAFSPHPHAADRLAAATHAGLVFLFSVTTHQLLPSDRGQRPSDKTKKTKRKRS